MQFQADFCFFFQYFIYVSTQSSRLHSFPVRNLLSFFLSFLYLMHCFFSGGFEDFLFVIGFELLIMMCFCEVFFMFLMLGVDRDPWICVFIVFIKLEKLGALFFQIYFSFLLPLLLGLQARIQAAWNCFTAY